MSGHIVPVLKVRHHYLALAVANLRKVHLQQSACLCRLDIAWDIKKCYGWLVLTKKSLEAWLVYSETNSLDSNNEEH